MSVYQLGVPIQRDVEHAADLGGVTLTILVERRNPLRTG